MTIHFIFDQCKLCSFSYTHSLILKLYHVISWVQNSRCTVSAVFVDIFWNKNVSKKNASAALIFMSDQDNL